MIDLYLQQGLSKEAESIIGVIEARVSNIAAEQEYAYRLTNELAIILQQNGQVEGALRFYKKALLCMKKRHRNKFQEQYETAKILINIACLLEEQCDLPEAIRYFQHSIDVLYRIKDYNGAVSPGLINFERAKIHMSLAVINDKLGLEPQTATQYEQAITQFEKSKEYLSDPAIADYLLEARHNLKQLVENSKGFYSYQN